MLNSRKILGEPKQIIFAGNPRAYISKDGEITREVGHQAAYIRGLSWANTLEKQGIPVQRYITFDHYDYQQEASDSEHRYWKAKEFKNFLKPHVDPNLRRFYLREIREELAGVYIELADLSDTYPEKIIVLPEFTCRQQIQQDLAWADKNRTAKKPKDIKIESKDEVERLLLISTYERDKVHCSAIIAQYLREARSSRDEVRIFLEQDSCSTSRACPKPRNNTTYLAEARSIANKMYGYRRSIFQIASLPQELKQEGIMS